MRTTRLIVLGALLCQAGLLVAGAQAWAWASMVRSGQTLAQAVQGRRPCSVCRSLRRAKPASSLAAGAAFPALDWILPGARRVRAVEASRRDVPFVLGAIPESASQPDSPPPRLLPS